MDSEIRQIYFEQQSRFSNNCAIHTVNNLLGFPAFSTSSFNQICVMLESKAKSNGYSTKTKHIMGGDYDINVIEKALQSCGLETSWVDSRVGYKYKYESGTVPKGYILNIQSQQSILHKMLAYSSRHWVCIRFIDCEYYLLDSKKAAPIKIEDIDEYLNFVKQRNGQVLEVRGRINAQKKIEFVQNKDKFQSLIMENDKELKFAHDESKFYDFPSQKETEDNQKQKEDKQNIKAQFDANNQQVSN